MNGLDKAGQPEILQAAKTALIRLETAALVMIQLFFFLNTIKLSHSFLQKKKIRFHTVEKQ